MSIWNQTKAERDFTAFIKTHKDVKLHLTHLWRGFLQVIIANSEIGIHKDTVPEEIYVRMTEIRESVYRMAEELRRLGL